MKVRAAVAYKAKAPLVVETIDLDGPKEGEVLVEIKAISALADEHRAQIQNYLHATGLRVGLLVNFGHHPLVEHERFVL